MFGTGDGATARSVTGPFLDCGEISAQRWSSAVGRRAV